MSGPGRRRSRVASGAAQPQIRADEGIEAAVNYAIHISDFGFGAMVLDQAVGLKHVGADLRSEINVELGVFNLSGGFALFLHFELVELGAQHAHGALLLLVLGALILATGDQLARYVWVTNR